LRANHENYHQCGCGGLVAIGLRFAYQGAG
jgi:hypothetical protein